MSNIIRSGLRSVRRFLGDMFFGDWRTNELSLYISNEEIVELRYKCEARIWQLDQLLKLAPEYDVVSYSSLIADHMLLKHEWAVTRKEIENECASLDEFGRAGRDISSLIETDRRRLSIRNRVERAHFALETGLIRQRESLMEMFRMNGLHANFLLEELNVLREYAKSDESVRCWLVGMEPEWDRHRDSISKRLEDTDSFYSQKIFSYLMEMTCYRFQVPRLLNGVKRDLDDALRLRGIWSLQIFRKHRYPYTHDLIEEARADLQRITDFLPYESGNADIHRNLMEIRGKIHAAYDHFWQ